MSTTKTKPVSAKCNAKDKSKCRFHGHPDNGLSVVLMQEKINAIFQASAQPKEVPAKELTDNALSSSLEWKGKKPKWWAAYAEELENHPLLSTSAELVDVVDSPAGPLAVIWQHESHAANDLGVNLGSGYGIKTCFYKSMQTGETLGYIKMAYVDESTIERSFGDDEFTPFRVARRFDSSLRVRFENETEMDKDLRHGERNLTGEALLQKRREVWLACAKAAEKNIIDANGESIAYYNISDKHIPDDTQVEKDLKVYRKEYQKGVEEKKESFKAPYVDFSRVDEPLKGKGYGTALYVYTARMLGKENKVLRGSGLQSDDAQKVWDGFKKKFPNNVSKMNRDHYGEVLIDPILDFRQK